MTSASPFQTLRLLFRIVLLTCALFAPLIAMQSVQAGSQTLIVDRSTPPSGIGLVLVVSLQRS